MTERCEKCAADLERQRAEAAAQGRVLAIDDPVELVKAAAIMRRALERHRRGEPKPGGAP